MINLAVEIYYLLCVNFDLLKLRIYSIKSLHLTLLSQKFNLKQNK